MSQINSNTRGNGTDGGNDHGQGPSGTTRPNVNRPVDSTETILQKLVTQSREIQGMKKQFLDSNADLKKLEKLMSTQNDKIKQLEKMRKESDKKMKGQNAMIEDLKKKNRLLKRQEKLHTAKLVELKGQLDPLKIISEEKNELELEVYEELRNVLDHMSQVRGGIINMANITPKINQAMENANNAIQSDYIVDLSSDDGDSLPATNGDNNSTTSSENGERDGGTRGPIKLKISKAVVEPYLKKHPVFVTDDEDDE